MLAAAGTMNRSIGPKVAEAISAVEAQSALSMIVPHTVLALSRHNAVA